MDCRTPNGGVGVGVSVGFGGVLSERVQPGPISLLFSVPLSPGPCADPYAYTQIHTLKGRPRLMWKRLGFWSVSSKSLDGSSGSIPAC